MKLSLPEQNWRVTRKIETQYEPKRKNSLLSKHLKHGFKTLRRFLYVILQRETIPFWWTKNQPKRKQLTSRISCIHTAFIGGATSPFPYQILKRACHFACVLSNDLLSFHALSLSLYFHTHKHSLSFALVLAPAIILLLCYISLCRWSLSWFHLSRQVSLRSFNRSQCSTVINRVMCVCVLLCVYNWIGVCYKCLKHTHSFRFDFYGEFGMKESEQLWERESANDIGTVNNTVALYILPAPQRFRIGIEGAYCILTLSAEPCMNISRSSIWSLIICVWGRTSMIHTDPNRKEWNGKRICTWVNEHRRSHVSNMLARSLAVISLRGKIYIHT